MKSNQMLSSVFNRNVQSYVVITLLLIFFVFVNSTISNGQGKTGAPVVMDKVQKAQKSVETNENAVLLADSLRQAAESMMDQSRDELQGAKGQQKEIDKEYSAESKTIERELKNAKGEERQSIMENKRKVDSQYKIRKKENETAQKNALKKFEKGKKDLAKAEEKLKTANAKLKDSRKALKEAEKAEEKKL